MVYLLVSYSIITFNLTSFISILLLILVEAFDRGAELMEEQDLTI